MIAATVGVLAVLAATAAIGLRDGPDEYDWRVFRRAQAFAWVLTGSVLVYVFVVEGASLDSLTYPPVASTFDAFAWTWILVAGSGLGVAVVFQRAGWAEFGAAERALLDISTPRALALSVSAGVTEEVVFRGYLVTRIVELTGSELAAVAVSTVAFAAYHAASRGRARLVQIAVLGAAFGTAFVVTGSLLAAVVIHAAYDALSLVFSDPEALDDVANA